MRFSALTIATLLIATVPGGRAAADGRTKVGPALQQQAERNVAITLVEPLNRQLRREASPTSRRIRSSDVQVKLPRLGRVNDDVPVVLRARVDRVAVVAKAVVGRIVLVGDGAGNPFTMTVMPFTRLDPESVTFVPAGRPRKK
jgi:hypothetical protein